MKFAICILTWLLLAGGPVSAQVHCKIRGSFPGLKTDEVQLVAATVDYRYHGVYVPVDGYTFEYELDLPHIEGYKLIFVTKDPREWYFVTFIAENATLDIRVNADKSYTVQGGPLNDEYQKFREVQKTKNRAERYECMHPYFAANPGMVYYFSVIEELQRRELYDEPIDDRIENAYRELAARYPSHPYTVLGKNLVDGFHTIRPGGRYVEFEAPDLDGRMVNLTDRIGGKVAVIDLWASWCMPCRAKAKAMIPLYEKYKDRGFEIVGVAREFKNTDRMKAAIANDKYPWLQLVELDDRQGIWTRYLLGNAGGGVFLVGRDGKFLLTDASVEQIKAELIKIFGE